MLLAVAGAAAALFGGSGSGVTMASIVGGGGRLFEAAAPHSTLIAVTLTIGAGGSVWQYG